MKATGYKPGIQTATGNCDLWTSAIVRVECSFQINTGQIVRHARGSGFVMLDWPGVILTARHLVVLPPAVAKQRMKVVVSAPNAAGAWEEVDALAVGYLKSGGLDVATLVIAGTAPHTLTRLDPAPSLDATFDGQAAGYLSSGTALTRLSSRIRREGALLRELDKPSVGGMSGGPACDAQENVCGIQSRDDHGQGLATLLDFDVLNPCAEKARSLVQ